jgi:hypothetical protein
VKLSKDDVQRACVIRLKHELPDVDLTDREILKAAFYRAIDQKHDIPGQSIPVWDGYTVCFPGNRDRIVARNGLVSLNCWKEPAYRRYTGQRTDFMLAHRFVHTMIGCLPETLKFLDWLAWCLQNEGDKPAWAPFLYSETKGSGKSTLCQLVSRLFGEENTAVLNSVEKLTSRFNSTALSKKLVICEEVNLRPDSPQGNALKTYITEDRVMTERKGVDAEAVEQRCCFLFTSNHPPFWIEEYDRRYYMLLIDHQGHAAGPSSAEFAELVGQLKVAMDDEAFLASLYWSLMERKLRNDFSAKTLNVVTDATRLSKRIHGASEAATVTLMREYLAEMGQHAVPEADVARIISEKLKGNLNQSKHLMTKLGWYKDSAKWDRKDYVRALWIEDGYWIERGTVRGPGGYAQSLTEHLDKPAPSLLPDDDLPQTDEGPAGEIY